MNDTELDELLNTWTAPEAPASLRARVRTGFVEALGKEAAPRVWPRRVAALARRTPLAAAFLALGACVLLVVTAAFPQTATLLSPREAIKKRRCGCGRT